jgi:hypothetical protein
VIYIGVGAGADTVKVKFLLAVVPRLSVQVTVMVCELAELLDPEIVPVVLPIPKPDGRPVADQV